MVAIARFYLVASSYLLLQTEEINSFHLYSLPSLSSPTLAPPDLSLLPSFSSTKKCVTVTCQRSDTSLYADVVVESKQESFEPTLVKDEDEQKVWTARLLILFAACLYGTNYTCVKVIGENIPLQIGAALRFSVAAIATLPWLLKQNESLEIDAAAYAHNDNNYGVLLAGAEIGFLNSIGFYGQAMGLQTTPASTSAFICSLAVVIVPLIDFMAGKKILSREIIGALLAVVGVGFLEMDGLREDLAAGNSLLSPGTLYSLIQPVAFGFGFWRLEHWTRKYPEGGMQLTASMMLFIAALMTGVVLLGGTEIPDFDQFATWLSNPTIIGATLWTGIVTTVLPTFLETRAMKSLSASETTMLYSTEPIFGSLFASFALDESMGLGGGMGAAMVLSGCLYSSLGAAHLEKD